jgi:hypothetical protein
MGYELRDLGIEEFEDLGIWGLGSGVGSRKSKVLQSGRLAMNLPFYRQPTCPYAPGTTPGPNLLYRRTPLWEPPEHHGPLEAAIPCPGLLTMPPD